MAATTTASGGQGSSLVPPVMRSATRYPRAYAAQTESGWGVYLFGAEPVLPLDVTALLEEQGVRPFKLRTTAREALDSLASVADQPSQEEAAAALERHCQLHPADLQLCAEHGLPRFHKSPDESPEIQSWAGVCSSPLDNWLSVASVQKMINCMRGIEGLAHRVVAWRTPATQREVDDATQWELLGERVNFYRSRMVRERLPLVFCKLLINDSVEELFRGSRTRIGYRWLPQHGLRLATHAGTDLGLYAIAFVGHMLSAMNIAEKPLAVTCLNCRELFSPRNGKQQFCQKPECRRAHAARNRQRERRERAHLTDSNRSTGADR